MSDPAPDARPRRYDQCDEMCTADCGHCKGAGPPASRVATDPQETAPVALLDRVDGLVAELTEFGVPEVAVEPVRDWVRDRRAGKPQLVVFFGCWREVGHFLHLPGGRRPKRDDPRFPTYYGVGPFKSLDGRLTPSDTRKQSTAAIHHRDGWTAIGIHDYTVDKRGGANSVFVMDSDLSFERVLTYAAEAFPTIVQRIQEAAPISCVQIEGARDE